MTEGFEYKAFLSYSHKDKKWGEWLHKKLERYKIPENIPMDGGAVTGKGRTIGRIFRDRDELPAAEDLNEAVEKALKSSEFLVVLCSPASAASVWVNKEVLEFKRLRGDRYVLPFIIEGEPFASDTEMPELECFPPGVRFKLGKNGNLSTLPAEPAAADARRDKDGKQRALLKILAGILGVGLDQLVERDLRRRHKRVMTITAGAIVAMIAMGALTLEAYQAREEADRSRADAEDLVEFMLTDLRERLEPVGRLDVLDAVGEKVLSYHDNAAQYEDASDDDIGRRARAYHLLAEMQYRRGNMDEAQTMFEQAADATGELLKRDPNNTQRIFEHSQSVFWVGNQDFERGNFAQAEIHLLKYKEMSELLVEMEPDNLDWHIEVAYGYHNIGDLLLRGQNQAKRAIPFIEKAATLFAQAHELQPNKTFLKRYVARQFRALADAHNYFDHLTVVREFQSRERKVIDELLLTDPLDQTQNRRLAYWFNNRGWQDLVEGNFQDAIKNYEQALSRIDQLLALDPNNSLWRDDKGLIELYLLNAYLDANALTTIERLKNLRQSTGFEKRQATRHQIDADFLEKLVGLRMSGYGIDFRGLDESLDSVIGSLNSARGRVTSTQRGRWIHAKLHELKIRRLLQESKFDEAARLKEQLFHAVEAHNFEQIPALLKVLASISTLIGDEEFYVRVSRALHERGYRTLGTELS